MPRESIQENEAHLNHSPGAMTIAFATAAARIGRARVLFVTNTDGVGGTERHLVDLIQRLAHTPVEISILQLGLAPYRDLLSDASPVETLTASFAPLDWWSYFRRNKPDAVVFVNGGLRAFPWYASAMVRAAGVRRAQPCVWRRKRISGICWPRKDRNARARRSCTPCARL